MALLDWTGKPFPDAPPTRPLAEVSATGVREDVFAPVGRYLTPQRLATILDTAAQGDPEEYWTLAEEMEETDLHYYSVLSTRKLAVLGLERRLEPPDGQEGGRAKEIADACRKAVIERPNFGQLMYDLLDGLGKGTGIVQPVWDTTTRPWSYAEFRWTDQRWFKYDTNNVRRLLLRTDRHPEGEAIPPGRFIVHVPTIKSGYPVRSGFARLAAIAYMAKKYTLKDWLAFMEVFGMPTRIGKYDPGITTATQKDQLLSALQMIGADACALIPEGMAIEILDAKRPSGADSLFGGLANYLDEQLSKGILGQTMTADSGSSLAQAKVHQMVRQDILEADARQLEATINQYVIAPWVLYNYGEGAPVPMLRLETEPPEDLELFTKAALPWVEAAKKRVSSAWLEEKFGIPESALEEEPEPEVPAPVPGQPVPAPGQPGGGIAENARKPTPVQTQVSDLDTTSEELATQYEIVLGDQKDLLQQIAEQSLDYEDYLRRLKVAAKSMDSDMLVRKLALETAKARGAANA